MESDKSDEDEHEAISKQIVDYYQKHSQSKQLPKYFAGTPLSYMPQIVKEDEIIKPIIIVECADDKPQFPADIEEPKVSPSSSVTSNRKLEWDSGADIGYNNCSKVTKLHKSVSLPSLMGTGDCKSKDKEVKSKLSSRIISIISYTSPKENLVERPQSSSSSGPVEKPPFSSSSSGPVENPVVDSSSSSSNPKTKPLSSSSSSSFAVSLAYLKRKIGSPDAESTPKLDECKPNNYHETPLAPKAIRKKGTTYREIDLCITKPIVIQCFDKRGKKGLDKRIQTSLIEGLSKCVQTGDSLCGDKIEPLSEKRKENQSVILITYESSSDKLTCSSNTQTSSEMSAAKCESFEYYKKQDKLKATSNVVLSDSSKTKDIPILGQLISEQQSKSLVGDIDKSILILQKLLKSKKYDPVTKKRYIKKIVEKIVDNKYNSDSTTSSELFQPKKGQQLLENLPWYPPKLATFSVKTFSDEFLPNQNQDSRKKSPFTITQPQETPSSSLERQNSSSNSQKSWKEDKTLSEKLLEERQKGQGDHLVKFAKKERQHQIAWISDEITHLTKLKGLLEKQQLQKTTTVYMLSEQIQQSGSSRDSNSQRSSARNYVIQTEISPTTSSDVLDFNLHDQNGQRNYRIREVVAKQKGDKNGRTVVGDIEVVSDENTTNIKVKTHKVDTAEESFVPKEPKLVGVGKYDTFPRSRAEEQRCWPCGMMKSRGAEIEGVNGAPKYSFEIPIAKDTSSLIKKVDEILTKYGSKASVDNQCVCCKCGDAKVGDTHGKLNQDSETETKKKESSTSRSKSSEEVEPKTRTRYVSCCHCDSALQTDCICTENVKAQTEKCTCSDKEVQTREKSSRSTSSDPSSSSDSESSSSASGSVHSCLCCKRKNVTSKNLYDLRKKLSDKAYALCRPCYRQNQRRDYTMNNYCNPAHVCNCYTVVETKTLNEIKETITDLKDLEDQYCSCNNTGNSRRGSADYCSHCNCKLKKTSRNKNGIAYMLTFENQHIEKARKKKKKPYLEEIKIKIPTAYKKKHKDKENKRKKERRSHSGDSEGNTTSESHKGKYNLQEYLKQNRPDFVHVAEDRRKSVISAREQREEMTEHNKLLFLQRYMDKNTDKNPKRIFSAKEIREITKRNYQRLPEVQRKRIDNKEKQIRQANRLMADTFNRKLRENVLKGKRSLPTDVNVVTL